MKPVDAERGDGDGEQVVQHRQHKQVERVVGQPHAPPVCGLRKVRVDVVVRPLEDCAAVGISGGGAVRVRGQDVQIGQLCEMPSSLSRSRSAVSRAVRSRSRLSSSRSRSDAFEEEGADEATFRSAVPRGELAPPPPPPCDCCCERLGPAQAQATRQRRRYSQHGGTAAPVRPLCGTLTAAHRVNRAQLCAARA